MRTGCIYMATVNDDLSKCYIGMTVDFKSRLRDHKYARADTKFHATIRKYGFDAVTWRILEDDIPENRLDDREELWIGWYDTYYNGLNATPGGSTPFRHPDVHKKAAATQREKGARGEHHTQTPEFKAKLSALMRKKAKEGTHQSQQPATKAKMSAGAQKALAEGRHPSQNPERNAKISKANRDRFARGEHHLQQHETHVKRMRTWRKNRGILDWVDMLIEGNK